MPPPLWAWIRASMINRAGDEIPSRRKHCRQNRGLGCGIAAMTCGTPLKTAQANSTLNGYGRQHSKSGWFLRRIRIRRVRLPGPAQFARRGVAQAEGLEYRRTSTPVGAVLVRHRSQSVRLLHRRHAAAGSRSSDFAISVGSRPSTPKTASERRAFASAGSFAAAR